MCTNSGAHTQTLTHFNFILKLAVYEDKEYRTQEHVLSVYRIKL